MQHYWGHVAIGKRIDVGTRLTVIRYIRNFGFPAYKRVNPHTKARQPQLYSNESLILAWEISMCKQHRERLIATGKPSAYSRVYGSMVARIDADMTSLVKDLQLSDPPARGPSQKSA